MITQSDITALGDLDAVLHYPDGSTEDFVIEAPNGSGMFNYKIEEIQESHYRDKNRNKRKGFREQELILEFNYSSHYMNLIKLLLSSYIEIDFGDFNTHFSNTEFVFDSNSVSNNWFNNYVIAVSGSDLEDSNPVPSGSSTLQFKSRDVFTESNYLVDDKKLLKAEINDFSTLLAKSTVTEGLVSAWPFNGGSNDIIGSNHGTINGDPQFVEGVSGQALEFDGVDDYVQIDGDPFSEEGAISFRVKADWSTLDNGDVRMIGTDHPNGGADEIRTYNNGLLDLLIKSNGSQVSSGAFGAGGTPDDGVLYDIVYQWKWDGTTLTLESYRDGVFQESNTMNEPFPLGANNFTIAKWASASFFPGLIDELRIYNRALSEAEIKQLYENPGFGDIIMSSNSILEVHDAIYRMEHRMGTNPDSDSFDLSFRISDDNGILFNDTKSILNGCENSDDTLSGAVEHPHLLNFNNINSASFFAERDPHENSEECPSDVKNIKCTILGSIKGDAQIGDYDESKMNIILE